jgi:hypothetical protein
MAWRSPRVGGDESPPHGGMWVPTGKVVACLPAGARIPLRRVLRRPETALSVTSFVSVVPFVVHRTQLRSGTTVQT